jgi:hypothetical protein
LKKVLRALRYLFTLKWIFDIIAKMNKTYGNIIYKTKHFKSFALVYKIFLILGIILCLILKYTKQSQIKNIDDKPEEENNNDILEDDDLDPNYLNNLRHLSEERWRVLKNN